MDDFNPKMRVILDQKAFIFTLAHSPCIFSSGLLGMVYELLRDCFVPNDFAIAFNLFFEICGHIVQGHVPPSISHLFSTSQLLMLEKHTSHHDR
jgi:hypothetical protein